MRPNDTRTPRDIALQAIDHKITLPDETLCENDHRTAKLNTPGSCAWPHYPNPDSADTVPCEHAGLYGTKQQTGQPARRGCAGHTAAAIRARLQLERRRLEQRGS